MPIEFLKRDSCVICNSELPEATVSIRKFPLYSGAVSQSSDLDIFGDINWAICKNCGTIQLTELAPLDIVYQYNHSDAIGKTWGDHNKQFALFIKKYGGDKKLEIGGATGKLALSYRQIDNSGTWVIVEPKPILENDIPNINLSLKWFDESYKPDSEFDTIVSSHVMEHWYEPDRIINNIANILPDKGRIICSFPRMEIWLKKKFTNCLSFEHTYYLDEEVAEYLFARHSIKLIAKEYFGEHSVFLCLEKTGKTLSKELTNKFQINSRLLNEMLEYYNNFTKQLNHNITLHKGDVYIFGAHVFSQYLFCLGLEEKRFASILDNAVSKIEKRLYGTNLMIESPIILKDKKNALVVLNCGTYNDEIKNVIEGKINSDILFC